MEKNHPITEMMDTAIDKIREMVDVNTIVGQPIVADGVTVVPISRVSIGFGSGGSDYVSKHPSASGSNPFGGASGAGISIVPIGFLVIRSGNVRMIPIAQPAGSAAERVVDMIPDVVEKVSAMIPKKDAKKGEAAE